ncbi:cache domain-containing protein, partial [Campylobacter peloridis]|uniref:hypothetical protein n=1 Tax=Campylobacter peloridis TaxID=488546 RepID=UPI001C72E772
MFSNLKIGTKIVAVVLAVIVLGIGVLSTIIAIQSSNTLHKEADKLLQASAFRYSNIVRGSTESVHATLLGAESAIDQIIAEQNTLDEARIQDVIEGALDANSWINYMYVHIVDISKFDHINPMLLTETNRFLMLLNDTDLKTKGGVKLVQADDRVLNQRSVKAALENKEEGVGRPQKFVINNEEILAYNIAIPITRNGKLVGVIGALAGLESLQAELTDPERSVFKDDQRLLLGADGLIAVSPATEFIGKNITDINPHSSAKLLVELQKNQTNTLFDFIPATTGNSNRAALVNFNLWDGSNDYWSIVTMAPVGSIQMPIQKLIFSIVIGSLIV